MLTEAYKTENLYSDCTSSTCATDISVCVCVCVCICCLFFLKQWSPLQYRGFHKISPVSLCQQITAPGFSFMCGITTSEIHLPRLPLPQSRSIDSGTWAKKTVSDTRQNFLRLILQLGESGCTWWQSWGGLSSGALSTYGLVLKFARNQWCVCCSQALMKHPIFGTPRNLVWW